VTGGITNGKVQVTGDLAQGDELQLAVHPPPNLLIHRTVMVAAGCLAWEDF
jgi:hypothetical protein